MVETTYIQNWSQILVNDNDVGENSDVDVDVVDGDGDDDDDDDDGDGDGDGNIDDDFPSPPQFLLRFQYSRDRSLPVRPPP